jgi:hypothetical protein
MLSSWIYSRGPRPVNYSSILKNNCEIKKFCKRFSLVNLISKSCRTLVLSHQSSICLQEEFENLTEAASAALGGAKASDLKIPNSTEGHGCGRGDSSKPSSADAAAAAKGNSDCSVDSCRPAAASTPEGNSCSGGDSSRPSDASAAEGNSSGGGDISRPSDASAAVTTAGGGPGGFNVFAAEVLFIA